MRKFVPNYELYGDFLAGRAADSIHLETIRERSSKHNWTIRVHQHQRLAQIFFFRTPGVFLSLGEIEHLTTQSTFLVIPPGVTHGFRFSEDVVGDVLSIRLAEMPERFQGHFDVFRLETASVFPREETGHFDKVATLFDQLTEAYHVIDQQREDVMTALIDLIVLYLMSDRRKNASPSPTSKADRRGRQDLQSEAFCTSLEENFRQPLTVSDYAKRVGLSAPHLTRVCRTVLGAPPNALIQQRRILEAKRLLEYTALSIAEISERSGFNDPAFFSRTFKSQVGITPKAYRANLNH